MRTDFFRSLFQDTHQSHATPTELDDMLASKQTHTIDPELHQQEARLSADEFLAQVTKGLKIGVKELLRLGIITQQDITDLENGMYDPVHVDAYRALVEQQLTLKLAPAGKNL